MRGDPDRVVKWLPTKDIIEAARVASEKLLRSVLQLLSSGSCFLWFIRIFTGILLGLLGLCSNLSLDTYFICLNVDAVQDALYLWR